MFHNRTGQSKNWPVIQLQSCWFGGNSLKHIGINGQLNNDNRSYHFCAGKIYSKLEIDCMASTIGYLVVPVLWSCSNNDKKMHQNEVSWVIIVCNKCFSLSLVGSVTFPLNETALLISVKATIRHFKSAIMVCNNNKIPWLLTHRNRENNLNWSALMFT